jgi:hypothetical protein
LGRFKAVRGVAGGGATVTGGGAAIIAVTAKAHGSRALEAQRRARLVQQGNASKQGNARKQLRARKQAKRYVKLAAKLRERRPDLSLNSIITDIRRTPGTHPSPRQLRRYLRDAGLK